MVKYKVNFDCKNGIYEKYFDSNEDLISALKEFGKDNIKLNTEYEYRIYNKKGELLNKNFSELNLESDDIICSRCNKIFEVNQKFKTLEFKNMLLLSENELEPEDYECSINICENCFEIIEAEIMKKWIELENLIRSYNI